MGTEDQPEIATVTAKGQITIPSSLRERYEIDEGESVEEFRERVEEGEQEVDIDIDDVNEMVHEGR